MGQGYVQGRGFGGAMRGGGRGGRSARRGFASGGEGRGGGFKGAPRGGGKIHDKKIKTLSEEKLKDKEDSPPKRVKQASKVRAMSKAPGRTHQTKYQKSL